MNHDINADATRQLAETSTDLRLIAAASGNFHSAHCSAKALNAVLSEVVWSLKEQPVADEAVEESIGCFVRLLADRGRLPRATARLEETEEFVWSSYRMLFAGLGHAHHATVVAALERVEAGCPWPKDETLREWQDAVLQARKASHWPAALLRTPWRPLVEAMGEKADDGEHSDGKAFSPWWREACLLWHVARHLRRGEGVLVYTYDGRWGAVEVPRASTSLATHTTTPTLCRHLGVPANASSKDAHPLAATAHDFFTTTNRALLLPRRPLATLPVQVLASPASGYVQDRSRHDPWFEHRLGLDHVWVANDGHVLPAANMSLSSHILLGYDWRPDSIPATVLEAMPAWKDRLVPTYDASSWPSQIFADAFPNIRWRSQGHRALFDAIACLSVVRDCHPILARELPLIVLLAANPADGEHIRNGKSAATKALVSMFAPDAPVTGLSTSPSNMEARITLVGLRDHGTVGLDEWQLPSDGNHPLNREAIATLCTGGTRSCGLVLSNEPLHVRLRNPLVVNAKTVALPIDLESRALFLWLDVLSSQQTANGDAYQQAVSGKLGLRMRLSALAQAHATGLAEWVTTMSPSTTQTGWRFGIHRSVAAGILAVRKGYPDLDGGLAEIDEAHGDMIRAYRAHTDAGEASGVLDMVQMGRTLRVTLEQLFDIDVGAMTNLVTRIRTYARAKSFTPSQLMRAVLEPFTASDPNGSLSSAFARFTGSKTYESATPRLLITLLAQDLAARVPIDGSPRYFNAELGLAGWWIRRESPPEPLVSDTPEQTRKKAVLYTIGCDDPLKDSPQPIRQSNVLRPNAGSPAPKK